MFESAVFQAADRELDDSVSSVEPIGGDAVEGGVGDERVVPPVWPQLPLGRFREPGPSNYQSDLTLLWSIGASIAASVARLG